jgi:hypothetical protein
MAQPATDSSATTQPHTALPNTEPILETPSTRYSATNTRYQKQKPKGFKKFLRKSRQSTRNTLQKWPGWEVEGREPYHDYIHRLVEAGWDNLASLDQYMAEDREDDGLIVSVLDISEDFELRAFPDIRDEVSLKLFIKDQSRERSRVRFYMAEQRGTLASGVIEALGSGLKLDPRFFHWNLFGNEHLMSPSERHRAPYSSIGFKVLKNRGPTEMSSAKTASDVFTVSTYIQPDAEGDGWTGEFIIWETRFSALINFYSGNAL